MIKNFQSVEEMIEDETFQGWFFSRSGEEVANWENWLAANPSQQPLAEEAIAFMMALKLEETPVPGLRTEDAYQRLVTRLDDQEKAPVVSMRSRRRGWLSAAAAVLLVATGLLVFKFSSTQASLGTQYGEISSNQLPDGSTMMLNANSTARLGTGWKGNQDREVWLKGEAFFHVKKTPQKNRFIVHTNELDVIVTGTQFNVWTRDNKTSVLLTEGSVTIKTSDGRETKMTPGDFLEINNSNLEKKKVNEESVLAWKENKLIFDNASMAEAARIIHEHYGVKVIIADSSLDAKTITGILPNDSLDVLLRSLEATNDFRITRKDNDIYITKP